MSKKKDLWVALVVSFLIVFVTLLLSQHSDTSRIFIDAGNLYGKGYPFVFYIVGNFDYGSNFYFLPFIANLVIFLVIGFVTIFVARKLLDRR